MAQPFNPFQALVADLDRGILALDSAPRLLVPIEALAALCVAAGDEATHDFGAQLGTQAGQRLAGRLKRPEEASIEVVVEHLGGEVALLGLGNLAVERWGRALVLRIASAPSSSKVLTLLTAAVLEGALQRGLSRSVKVVPLGEDDTGHGYCVVGAKGADSLRGWIDEGVSWGDALVRLQTARGGAAS